MRRKTAILGLLATALVSTMFAAEGRVPEGIPNLDHVFVIMMENHGFSQIIGNPDAPFANQYAKSANSATNYFAVGHPSSTNYLEIVGGSNFGVRSDNSPDWHNQNCSPNLGPTPYLTTDFPCQPQRLSDRGHRHGRGHAGRRLHQRVPESDRDRPLRPGINQHRRQFDSGCLEHRWQDDRGSVG